MDDIWAATEYADWGKKTSRMRGKAPNPGPERTCRVGPPFVKARLRAYKYDKDSLHNEPAFPTMTFFVPSPERASPSLFSACPIAPASSYSCIFDLNRWASPRIFIPV
ncbi:hypothetical protein CCMA1212_007872 [Trichoderma ghanense]|uniref:Uncharacterized protein n=1 Tax=Trichoderma ghanense TaxID=65468 RepID=A0ABY2GWZ2_9HYPO